MYPDGLTPRHKWVSTASGTQASNTAHGFCQTGFVLDPESPLSVHSGEMRELTGMAAATLCIEHSVTPLGPVNTGSVGE